MYNIEEVSDFDVFSAWFLFILQLFLSGKVFFLLLRPLLLHFFSLLLMLRVLKLRSSNFVLFIVAKAMGDCAFCSYLSKRLVHVCEEWIFMWVISFHSLLMLTLMLMLLLLPSIYQLLHSPEDEKKYMHFFATETFWAFFSICTTVVYRTSATWIHSTYGNFHLFFRTPIQISSRALSFLLHHKQCQWNVRLSESVQNLHIK